MKSEICGAVSDFIFLYVEKMKSEICGAVSDFIFLYEEKIKSEIFVPFGHRSFRPKRPVTNVNNVSAFIFIVLV